MTDLQNDLAEQIEATEEQRAALKHRLVRAREVFAGARRRIRYEHDVGEISSYQRDHFLAIVDSIEPAHTDPDAFGEEHVAEVERAVVALRDKAIEVKLSGDICEGGLNRFLRAAGLRMWSRFQPDHTEGSPYAADYPDDDLL